MQGIIWGFTSVFTQRVKRSNDPDQYRTVCDITQINRITEFFVTCNIDLIRGFTSFKSCLSAQCEKKYPIIPYGLNPGCSAGKGELIRSPCDIWYVSLRILFSGLSSFCSVYQWPTTERSVPSKAICWWYGSLLDSKFFTGYEHPPDRPW